MRTAAFAFDAGDDQMLARPRHADVEEAPVFIARRLLRHVAGVGHAFDVISLLAGPDHRLGRSRSFGRKRQKVRVARAGRPCRGVGQNNDRRFKPLGAVHGHHPHFIARDLHVALDLRARRSQPGHEPLQGWCFAAFVVERQVEEFIEGVGRFVAQPRENALAPPRCAEQVCIECEWRVPARRLGQRVEADGRVAEHQIVGRFGAQRSAQRGLAVPSERKQLLVREAEQRASQHRRKREIVLRQQQRVGEHHEVHDRDMLGQGKPVSAGDLDRGVLERPDDRAEHRPALTHQDEHVARLPALLDPGFDAVGDLVRELYLRARLADGVKGRIPTLDLGLGIGAEQIPKLDQAGRGVRQRLMHGRHRIGGQPLE